MTEHEQELVALDQIWRRKIINKLESDIKRREQELRKVKEHLKRVKSGEKLPEIDRDKMNRFIWFCPQCEKVSGKNFLAHTIPFVTDAICKTCKGRETHDLMAIAKDVDNE